ncbi:nitroreductase family deazaflavin-dependent oxidoreductase [Streptomyces sp. NPDC086023]|uniref:nitroreductase family deazaflavin-dependent oxidoreductase n=1 Tax=Streptomyces sp. NPDC086023 TaxID=3365746 RepID=UPI0037D1A001
MSERLEHNQRVIDEFRATGGVVGGDFEGMPLLLLTTTGARSGKPRTSPMAYLRDGDRLVVFAANGGRENRPGWYHNLLADPSAGVEVGKESFTVTAAVAEGAERERLWAAQLAVAPFLADFQARSGRRVPVVTLTPAGA